MREVFEKLHAVRFRLLLRLKKSPEANLVGLALVVSHKVAGPCLLLVLKTKNQVRITAIFFKVHLFLPESKCERLLID